MSKKYQFQDSRIWITGASSGIGAAMAIALAARGAKVAISARHENTLKNVAEKIPPKQVLILPCDVTDLSANKNAIAAIIDTWGGLDMVILNAGTCEYIDLPHFDSAIFQHLITSNYMSMVYGIEAALPALRASRKPYLVGTSSVAAYLGLPRAEAYAASKAAIRVMLQSLRIDLWQENIPVSIISPGFVKTPLTDRNDFDMPFLISAEKAAGHILKGLEHFQHEIHFPKRFTYLVKLAANLPTKWISPLLSRLKKRQPSTDHHS
jgi:NADP-dependent 3-hydroxy acid dehydrogenase YdfG